MLSKNQLFRVALRTAVAVFSLFMAPLVLSHTPKHQHCEEFVLDQESNAYPTTPGKMNCKVNYFFKHTCKALGMDGEKWMWSSWGFGSIPTYERRCKWIADDTPHEHKTIAKIQWWGSQNFVGEDRWQGIDQFGKNKCVELFKNDHMKSMKLHAEPGYSLEIFDSPNCSKDDDWGVITVPLEASMVELPKIGRRGPREVRPAGSYKFHRHNGLSGKVSAVRLTWSQPIPIPTPDPDPGSCDSILECPRGDCVTGIGIGHYECLRGRCKCIRD